MAPPIRARLSLLLRFYRSGTSSRGGCRSRLQSDLRRTLRRRSWRGRNSQRLQNLRLTRFPLSRPAFCAPVFLFTNANTSPNIDYYYDFTLRSHGVRRRPLCRARSCQRGCWPIRRLLGILGLKAWDTAAGVLLVEEAGGKNTDFHEQPYHLGGPVVLATNGLIHEEMRVVALELSRRDPASGAARPKS